MNYTGHSKLGHRVEVLEIQSSSPRVECFCGFCGQKFDSQIFLKTHISNEHSLKSSLKEMTEDRQKVDGSSKILVTRKDEERLESKYSCKQCDFTTPSSVVLRNHELVHTYTKTCPHCSKKFFQDSHLKFHLATHGDHKNVKGSVPRIVSKANMQKILKRPPEPKERGEIVKRIKFKEEYLVESDPEVPEMMTTAVKMEMHDEVTDEVDETEDDPSSQEELDPVIQSICCDLQFQDLVSLLTHVHEVHTKTFLTTMTAMQPIVEETLQSRRVSSVDKRFGT